MDSLKDRADRAQNLISHMLCTLLGPGTIHMKSRFICLNMVSFERNLISTVNGISVVITLKFANFYKVIESFSRSF